MTDPYGDTYGDVYGAAAQTGGGQLLIEQDVYIRGISGTYGGTNRWSWSWQLQPATRYKGALWDSGKWDAAVWVF